MSRIFSGIQPSGALHIGNYLGAVKNWVELQRKYESFFCIVDYHAITVPYDPADLRVRTADMALSLLAAGLDPSKCTLLVQSMVPEHTELAWIFNTLTPLGELERQTQFKEKASREESVPAGLLNYPVLQAADILLYRAELVPVGEDQVQHLELSREIARKWNSRFGTPLVARKKGRRDSFPSPRPFSLRRAASWDSMVRRRCQNHSATPSTCSNHPSRSGKSCGPPLRIQSGCGAPIPERRRSAISITYIRLSVPRRRSSTSPCSA